MLHALFWQYLIKATEKSSWLKQILTLLVRLEMLQCERNASGRIF